MEKNIENKDKRKKLKSLISLLFVMAIIIFIYLIYTNLTNQSRILKKYFYLLKNKKYYEMYDLVDTSYSKEDFVNRIKNIYEGIDAKNFEINIVANFLDKTNQKTSSVKYILKMDTIAGKIITQNDANFEENNGKQKIIWTSNMIFKDLDDNEKVRIDTTIPKRGNILDRNNNKIAFDDKCYNVGIVKEKFDNNNIQNVSNALDLPTNLISERIKNSNDDNSFIYLKKLTRDNQELKQKLLKIEGILILDSIIRVYPYGEATSIMTGYVQDNNGKAGIEYYYNDRLKGDDGKEIYLEKDGEKVKTVLKKEPKDGENIKLTIDCEIQSKFYNQFKNDKGCSVSINYNTGEVLALVSYPSYDANIFSIGISQEEWNLLQNSEDKEMYNRYLSTYTPGSSIKPIIGSIGVKTQSFTSYDDFGKSGIKWQKDASWKDLYITNLEQYSGQANLKNALIYSDNIYFAKASLKIGKDALEENLNNLLFNHKIDFPQDITQSTFGNLDSDAKVANTGFGQGDLLVNPIHMACLYSMFANGGNIVQPYLEFSNNEKSKYIKQGVISSELSTEIKNDLGEVCSQGTAQSLSDLDKKIYGKTGTAEIKKNQTDKSGEEIGWFDYFDDNENLYICMVENVKNKNGSHYVVDNIKNIL